MKLGESNNDEARNAGGPLDGIRILAIEQMQVLPFATQLLARMGADVVKVESPARGDSGRLSLPIVTQADGQRVGSTFARNNLNKRSIAVDFSTDEGRQLVLDLAPHFDVVCENLGPGRANRAGLGYEAFREVDDRIVYASISGFGTGGGSPYESWPAYAAVAEAMTGMYEYSRAPHQPPVINPLGGIGDSGTGLYAVIGILLALMHRERTGKGQFVDISMYDCMLSLLDLAYNLWSLGIQPEPDEPRRVPLILDSFRARDGWVVLQIARPHQFERLAEFLDHPEWVVDPAFSGSGWYERFEPRIRPALEAWALTRTMKSAAGELAAKGIAAAPCYRANQIADDEHVKLRHMVVEIPTADGQDRPILVAGNPIKLSNVAEGPDRRLPWLGEHTDEILTELLGLDEHGLTRLRRSDVVADPAAQTGGASEPLPPK
jgi:crotonobetainyl-CoA:carnitine CoA-transferase CaiB-like acyl-CoA transferase